MKRLMVLLSIALLLGAIATISVAEDTNKAQKIIDAVNDQGMAVEGYDFVLSNGTAFRHLEKKINTTQHDYFEWTWTWHYCDVVEKEWIVINTRDYRSLSTPGRQYIEWFLYDYNADGEVDKWRRDIVLLQPTDYEDEETGESETFYYHLSPIWPEDFLEILNEWRVPPKEKAQALYNDELNFWVGMIGKNI